jgi:glucose/arabinose dehydrogenase
MELAMRSPSWKSRPVLSTFVLALCLPLYTGHTGQVDVGAWSVRPGYVVELVATGFRLPVNIAFVPNPGPNPTDPLFYVAELYGSIKVVRNDGTVSTFATGLLDYNPQGPIPGTGEQGLTGIAVDPLTGSLYVSMLWNNGTTLHFPKVERLDSHDGGLTFATRTVLLNMQPEAQGPSRQISNLSIGPDDKLYVHMGDGFVPSTALNLNQFRGKVLRMNRDGTPPIDNPFFNAADGITATDYIFTYGHGNPFGGGWRAADGRHWIVEMGSLVDRLVDLVSGQSYGWSGDNAAILTFSKYNWIPAALPVNIDFVESTKFGGSGFPIEAFGHAYVSLTGPTYAAGPQERAKSIEEFSDLDTLDPEGKLAAAPSTLVKYNGAGRATIAGLAVGPDGIYFTDLYEDTGVNGPTAVGANVYRVRHVGTTGDAPPTIVSPASAHPNPVTGASTTLSVLGADDGGEASLTYTWAVQDTPPAPVTFSANGTNAAKNVVVTFTESGVYNFFVIIRDASNQTVTSSVTVTVIVEQPGAGNGLTARYYDNVNFTGRSVTRVDPAIDFDWGSGSPSRIIGPDEFSSRWEGQILPRFSETYTFITTTDDGVRLWIDNRRIINAWNDQGLTVHRGAIALTAGVKYNIVMEHRERTGEAVARLEWQSSSQRRQVVSQRQLFSTWSLNVNFQPAGAPVPAGYVADTGAAFARRGNGWSYGWNGDNTATAHDRDNPNSPDQRYDTLVHMQARVLPDAFWELAVPNGRYTVRIVAGDPDRFNSVYRIDVEGVLAINATPTRGERWFDATVSVSVTDARLTIRNAPGAFNNKIAFVDISQPPP